MTRRTAMCFILTMVLIGMFAVIGSPVKGQPLGTSTATTATPMRTPFDYSGISNTFPGERLSIATRNLKLLNISVISDASNSTQSDAGEKFGILFQDYQLNSEGKSLGARIGASMTVRAGIIEETQISLDGRFLEPISQVDWKLIDPMAIVRRYGVPSFVRAGITPTGVGLGSGVLIVWETDQVAINFNLYLKESDEMNNRILICLTPDRVVSARLWLTVPKIDVKRTIKDSNETTLIFGQPFSPTMFTNAPDLATFAQRLANGECLETPSEVWFK